MKITHEEVSKLVGFFDSIRKDFVKGKDKEYTKEYNKKLDYVLNTVLKDKGDIKSNEYIVRQIRGQLNQYILGDKGKGETKETIYKVVNNYVTTDLDFYGVLEFETGEENSSEDVAILLRIKGGKPKVVKYQRNNFNINFVPLRTGIGITVRSKEDENIVWELLIKEGENIVPNEHVCNLADEDVDYIFNTSTNLYRIQMI